jgi:hypothetical protein
LAWALPAGGGAAPLRGDARPARAGLVAILVGVLALAWSATPANATTAGYRDFSFGTGTSAPTSKEPQSKLWWNDGRWWGTLFNRTSGDFEIYHLDWATQTWAATSTLVDGRPSSKSDVLWDGSRLYVVSAGTSETSASHNARVMRYSYNSASKTYTLDSGFPVTLATSGGVGSDRAITIARDTTGTLWVAYTKSNKVWVAHSTTSDSTWTAPFTLPVSGATGLLSQDESAIVAFGGKVGIMWSNQTDWSYRFATHVDGTGDTVWQSTVVHQASEESDNHLSLRALSSDPAGEVFAAVKTSLNASIDPLHYVFVLKPDGIWEKHVASRVADDHTRAQLLIDKDNRQLYFFATSPCCSGGTIYYKKTSLDNISFPAGKGTPLIASTTDTRINDVTSTKQPLTTASGFLALASDDTSNMYLHNAFNLGATDTTPPDTMIDSGPDGRVDSSTATFTFSATEAGSTFTCSLDGAVFSACASPTTYDGLADGSHTFQVLATDDAGNTDPSPASRTWTVDTTSPVVTVAPEADARVEETNATANFGTNPVLISDLSPNAESYLRFSVTDIEGTVASATLRLFVTNGSSNGPAVYSAGNDWTETGVTWDTKPPRSGDVLEDKAAVSSNTWVEYDVTSAVNGNGTYTFEVAPTSSDGTDMNSRESASANKPELAISYLADTTPPETTIDSGPIGSVSATSASFAFSSSEPGSSFECSLDGAPFAACTSPAGYSALLDGSHTFAARATDPSGNMDPTAASWMWTVDTEPPSAPVIMSPPEGTATSSSTVTLSGTAEPNATVEVLDGAVGAGTTTADGTGSWSRELTGVSDGTHSYTSRATDAAGNQSEPSNTRTVVVDTQAPETTIDSGPSGTVTSASATFSFSASEAGSSFECSLDGAPFAACTSPTQYSGLAEGSHTFQVRATDPAGNTDPSPASRTWTSTQSLFADGFESGDFSAWTLVRTGGDGSATVQSSLVKSGTFAARLSETANTGSFAYARKSFETAQTDLTVSGDFRLLTEGASGGNVPFFRLLDAAGNRIASLYRQNASGDKVQLNLAGTTVITSGRLPLDTWGELKLHVITGGTGASTVQVWLDGALVYETTSATLGTAGVFTVQIGNDTAKQTFTLVADNISARVAQ